MQPNFKYTNKMKTSLIAVTLSLTINFSSVNSHTIQQVPQPIDLGIQNITQLTNSWCWAATAQQIIYWLTGSAPPQCQLVANAYNANPNVCCANPNVCNAPGYMQQIQSLIYAYGGHLSSISPPANPMAVYYTLAQGKAIILFLKTSPYVGHFVVLRGMAWVPTQFGYQPLFYINDPMSYYSQPVAFNQLASIWGAAIVVN